MCRRKGANKLWHRQPMTNLEAKEWGRSICNINKDPKNYSVNKFCHRTRHGAWDRASQTKQKPPYVCDFTNAECLRVVPDTSHALSYPIVLTKSWGWREIEAQRSHCVAVCIWTRGCVTSPHATNPREPFSREGSGLSALKFIFCLKQ